jgi:methyltransferase (TIGR00027 family)
VESHKAVGERVCYDPYAKAFTGSNWNPFGEFWLPRRVAFWLWELLMPGWNAYFVARTRFIDDVLEARLGAGLEQVVIMGAGYDSRALRYEQMKTSVNVFEVDHPATQQAKVAKLAEIFGSLPGHLHLVPVDFTRDTLERRLHDSGYEPDRRTLFIWEGVTMYLTQPAVDEALAFVSRCSGSGSSIIFDYTHPSEIDGTCSRLEATMWRKSVERLGEALLFGIEEGTIEAFLGPRGFSVITNANSDFMKRRYFTGINQSRAITPIVEIVHAAIGR